MFSQFGAIKVPHVILSTNNIICVSVLFFMRCIVYKCHEDVFKLYHCKIPNSSCERIQVKL